MRRTTLNFVIDTLLLLACCGLVMTGVTMRYILPPGTGLRHAAEEGREGGWAVWGLGRHDFGDLHFWLSVGAVVLFAVHVALHWNWVCTVLAGRRAGSDVGTPRRGVRNATGVLFGLLVIGGMGLFLWAADRAVDRSTVPGHEQRRNLMTAPSADAYGAESIRGSMTLAEAARVGGISVETLRRGLNLPETISGQERLGRLRRAYDFDMDRVREIIGMNKGGNRTP